MTIVMQKLADITEFVRNGASIKQDDNAGGLKITRIETIANKVVDLNKCGYADLSENDYLNYRLKRGDILISHINSEKHLGKCAIFDLDRDDIVHGMNLLALRTNKNADSKYVYHYLNSKKFLSLIPRITKKSVNQASFTVTAFKELEIPLPPLEEQKRIAKILDKADAIRQKRQQAIELADEFLRSVFLDMFGDPVTNPKGWDVDSLGNHIQHANNGLSRRRATEENVGQIVLRLQDVHYDGIRYEKDLNRINLDEKEKERYLLSSGDVLFVRVNGNPEYVGRSAVFTGYKEPVYHNDHLIRLRVSESYSPYFLSFLLNLKGGRKIIRSKLKTSAGQYTVSQAGIESMQFICPDIELQNGFCEIKDKIYLNLKKQNKYLFSSEVCFNSLSQKAFSGEL